MSGILAKYADLRVLNDRSRTNDLLLSFSNMTENEHALHFAGSAYSGDAFIKDSPGEQQAILECVVAHDKLDSFATLFAPHPLFSSLSSYREARDELMECVLDLADASVAGVAIMCPVRKRKVNVRDLGVMQLVELIQSAVDGWTGSATGKGH